MTQGRFGRAGGSHRRSDRPRRSAAPPGAGSRSGGLHLGHRCGHGECVRELFSTDAQALDNRLDALAATVCDADPRTRSRRRADALGAMATGLDRLACRCGQADCSAGGRTPAGPVVIHVIAEQATVEGRSDAPGSGIGADQLIPAELVAELASSAKLRPLIHPADAAPEPRYIPSQALADFVRCRAVPRMRRTSNACAESTVDTGISGLTTGHLVRKSVGRTLLEAG